MNRNLNGVIKKFYTRKEFIWRLYIYSLYDIYTCYFIYINLDSWTSFDSLFTATGIFLIIHILLIYILNDFNIQLIVYDLFSYINWLGKFTCSISINFMWLSVMILEVYSNIDEISIFITLTVFLLIFIHFAIYYLQKKRVDGNNLYIVLWLGLIGTFIGFTLSGYAQEKVNEETEETSKKNMEIILESAISYEKARKYEIQNYLFNIYGYLGGDDEHSLVIEYFSFIKTNNDALKAILNFRGY